ncbi:MAG: hypothetical protein D3909_13570 [Candidatus Electrothrix sp. ATG1]|nr:hypothetical protein [Candidatus Electrothrix sp. ATG1]
MYRNTRYVCPSSLIVKKKRKFLSKRVIERILFLPGSISPGLVEPCFYGNAGSQPVAMHPFSL